MSKSYRIFLFTKPVFLRQLKTKIKQTTLYSTLCKSTCSALVAFQEEVNAYRWSDSKQHHIQRFGFENVGLSSKNSHSDAKFFRNHFPSSTGTVFCPNCPEKQQPKKPVFKHVTPTETSGIDSILPLQEAHRRAQPWDVCEVSVAAPAVNRAVLMNTGGAKIPVKVCSSADTIYSSSEGHPYNAVGVMPTVTTSELLISSGAVLLPSSQLKVSHLSHIITDKDLLVTSAPDGHSCCNC